MYRWIISVLALLGYTGIAAHAQQLPQSNSSSTGHLPIHDNAHPSGGGVGGDGTSDP